MLFSPNHHNHLKKVLTLVGLMKFIPEMPGQYEDCAIFSSSSLCKRNLSILSSASLMSSFHASVLGALFLVFVF